jgi:endonuclease/exonuclease/phosphatase (EEP) superfamily protein YafD
VLSILELIVQLVIAALIVLSAAGYLGHLHKYFELTSHFKAQYLLASAVCLLISLILGNWWYAAGALICAGINLLEMVPWYTTRQSTATYQVKGQRLKLALANVNRCNTAHDALIKLVNHHRPDLVVAQEVDLIWTEALRALHQRYPFFEVLPRGGGSGIALYSRFSFERLPLVLPGGDERPGIMIRLDIRGVPVSLLSIHPRAPLRRGHFERRNKMLAASADILQRLPPPKICVGDLNISFWSPYYRHFEKESQLVNVKKGFGPLPSWPTFMRFGWLMIPIDHCLVSDDTRVINVQTGEPIGSDHLPLIVEMEIPGD